MRVVVTGASGLIGSRVVLQLADRGDEVVALRRAGVAEFAPAGSERSRAAQPHWLQANLARPELPSLPERCDAVVHLAQSRHFREFPERADDIFAINTAATARLLDYARRAGARSFVYASTGGVYRPGPDPLPEEAPLATGSALGFYAATKLAGELLAQQYASSFAVVILRFFFVYGPGQSDQMLMPRLLRSVREGKPIHLVGNEGIRINPTAVDDAAGAVVRALAIDVSTVVNVAGPEALSLRALAGHIGRVVGRDPVFETATEAAPGDLVADITRMRSLLWAPSTAPAEGIRGLVIRAERLP